MLNHRGKINSTLGFTLLELLLYVTIAGFIVFSLGGIFNLMLGGRVKNQTVGEVEQQGTQIMQIITQTVRNSTGVATPGAGLTSSSLSITVLVATQSPTVFDLSGSSIRITEGTGSPVNLNSSKVAVSALSFRNLMNVNAPPVIRIQFTLSYSSSSARNEYSFSKTFYGSAGIKESVVGPTPTPTSTACSTYCQSLGIYTTGVCRQNAVQCSNNGETHVPGGDQYCTVPSANVCCCMP